MISDYSDTWKLASLGDFFIYLVPARVGMTQKLRAAGPVRTAPICGLSYGRDFSRRGGSFMRGHVPGLNLPNKQVGASRPFLNQSWKSQNYS